MRRCRYAYLVPIRLGSGNIRKSPYLPWLILLCGGASRRDASCGLDFEVGVAEDGLSDQCVGEEERVLCFYMPVSMAIPRHLVNSCVA
jgi:hypothetical protein